MKFNLILCIPTTGSPTITLLQLRSNYHTVFDSHKMDMITKLIKLICIYTLLIINIFLKRKREIQNLKRYYNLGENISHL